MAHQESLAIHNQIHRRITDQLPEFMKEEGELFVKFLEAYYEWMDLGTSHHKSTLGASQHLLEFQDIDKTLNQYVEWFLREIAPEIPQTNQIDDRQNVKFLARELYRSKGTPKSYELLFRMIYDEEVTFYTPGQDLLAPSSGDWQVDTIIRVAPPYVTPPGTTIDDIKGRTVIGQESGATAIVESVIATVESGVTIREMTLFGVSGAFKQNETVRTDVAPFFEATIFTNIGTIDTLTITNGGAYHEVGDAVNITGLSTGTGANGTVLTTTDLSGVAISLANGGSGYAINTPITVFGGSGVDLAYEITSLSNTENISINNDKILFYKDVRLDGGGANAAFGVGTGGANNFAAANINTVIETSFTNTTVTVGTINAISKISYGAGYATLPGVRVENEQISALEITGFNGKFKGEDAQLVLSRVPGTIIDIEINKRGDSYNIYDEVSISNVPKSANTLVENAKAFPVISGIITRDGKYTDTKGFLSNSDKIQDNFYYQEFSYVIQSQQFVSAYRGLVNRLLNPAGTKLFGEYDIESENLQTDLVSFADTKTTITLDPGLGALIDYPSVISGSEATYISDRDTGGVVREDFIRQGDAEFTEAKVLDTVLTTIPDGFDVEIDIEPVADASITVKSEVIRFQKAQGTIGISNVATIAAYQSDPISSISTTAIADASGGNNIVIATGNAALTTILRVGERIIITPTDQSQPNGMYGVLSVTSNTSFRIGPAYNHNVLGFGNTFYHVIADRFSSETDYRFDDTELTFDSSNYTDGASKSVTLWSDGTRTFDKSDTKFDG